MRKYLFCLLLLLIVTPFTFLKASDLRFSESGVFKIVQFTDVHYKVNSPQNSSISIEAIEGTLESESPDLVILTGDIVTDKPVLQGWDEVIAPIVKRGIPFAVTFGNHDDESGSSREEIMRHLRGVNGCLNSHIGGENDFDGVITVRSSKADSVAAALYIFDSNSYSTIPSLPGYGWLLPSQIAAYNELSAKLTRENGGEALPSLAFLHIPIPEYKTAFERNSLSKPVGVRLENECPAALNTGLYASMKINGDVMGIFCGHDHDNDYLADMDGIAMVYGRFTGSRNTYTNMENGARVIVMKEGLRNFDSYIRLRSGDIINSTTYPSKDVRAMSFNIRMATTNDGDNQWNNRRGSVVNIVKSQYIDILGTQEALQEQVEYLKSELKAYNLIGVGREDGDKKGEYCAIMYRHDRFKEEKSGNFWLSKDPSAVGIKGWDAACERIATWAVLRDIRTGSSIFVLNTHFDHVGRKAQAEGAKLIKRQIALLKGGVDNVIVMGDLNVTPDNPAIAEMLKATKSIKLVDSRSVADTIVGPSWSFHGFESVDMSKRPLIDYIFVSEGASVKSQSIIYDPKAKRSLSDHNPIVSIISF
ncbi:MAG: endonuclease/exonuclease/phosphatase family protein [Bacteroidales bacterium]